jgi:uncharacterized repeat protein (TIGR03803 family)
MVAAAGSAAAAPTMTVLHSFTDGSSDGFQATSVLIADSNGNLYGTAAHGGASHGGVVFKLAPDGTTYTVLYSFCRLPSCSDGSTPEAGLIVDSAGNLYGTTTGGGVSTSLCAGCGTVFKLAPDGTETVLYSFCSKPGCNDGLGPQAGLIADSTGNLYGTTHDGGGSGCGGLGCGVVFKISPGGTETVLTGASDGAGPSAGLIADSAGNLYGTTGDGGAAGQGVVFKVSPGGTETVLHSFTGSDGATLQPGLIADSSGNLYGMTTQGGASGQGVVFKLAPAGTFRVLYSFCGLGLPCSDGAQPFAGLFADSSGNLYGTTIGGGSGTACQGSPCGVVFKLKGTEFCTAPFSALNAKLAIYHGPNPNQDAFGLLGSFTLASSSDGINPVTEPVTLQVGGFTAEIPPNSFTQSPLGTYSFIGTINGVDMEVVIQPIGGKQFAVEAAALNTNLTGTANPVTVKLSIGDDCGTTPVNAVIF